MMHYITFFFDKIGYGVEIAACGCSELIVNQ